MPKIIPSKITLKKKHNEGFILYYNKSHEKIFSESSIDVQMKSPKISMNGEFPDINYKSLKNSDINTIPLSNIMVNNCEDSTFDDQQTRKSGHTNSELKFNFDISHLLKKRRLIKESINEVSCQNTLDSKDMTTYPINNILTPSLKYSMQAPNIIPKIKKFVNQNFNKIELTEYLTYLTSIDTDTKEEKFRKRLNQDDNGNFKNIISNCIRKRRRINYL